MSATTPDPTDVAALTAASDRLAVIGGRLEDGNVAIYGEMHRLSRGRILVFPTASSEPGAVGAETAAVFRAHGFDVEVVRLTRARAARDPALVARIADWGSVYFTGGDQAKIIAALAPDGVDTPALAAIRAAQHAGGLVAGSSAGAAIMSKAMILGGTSLESVVHGLTDDPKKPGLLMGAGLGFFRFGLVDQHFIKRGRLGRLVVAMAATGVRRGFGVDENTALLVEDGTAHVVGEYGVMVVDLGRAAVDLAAGSFEGFRLSYLDDGDSFELASARVDPGMGKRLVRRREMAYRAPVRSRRNAFGAYTLYDLMARLVLGDPSVYTSDAAEAFDAKTGINVTVALERRRLVSRVRIATPETGLRMTAIDFRASVTSERLAATRAADRSGRPARTWGMVPRDEARMVLLGSSPLRAAPEMLDAALAGLGTGPVGVLAAASAEAARTASEHVTMLRRRGIEAVDLAVTIDTVEYAAHDPELLESIAGLKGILICGGNQIRLVETLLHRGEESAVLRAIAHAHAAGTTLIAASGAASALSGMMIAGGSSWEALRYGVSSDTGHRGLVIQEGVGLFGAGIVDQNLVAENRLGRLVVACAEENERFGIGVIENSAVVAIEAGRRLEAAGRHGFVLVEIDPLQLVLQSDSFIANSVRLTVLAPGDAVDLATGAIERAARSDAPAALLATMLAALDVDGPRPAGPRDLAVHIREREGATATIDLECPRDDNA